MGVKITLKTIHIKMGLEIWKQKDRQNKVNCQKLTERNRQLDKTIKDTK